MTEAKITCPICLREITEETPLHSVSNDSMEHPKLSNLPIKLELYNDENSLLCNKCKPIFDEGDQDFTKSQNLTQPFLTNFPSLANNENYSGKIKYEFVEVAIKYENEEIVKEEGFNMDISVRVEEFIASDMLYYCYQCNYATNDKEILTDHIFTHLFKCDLCSYATFHKFLLTKHEKVHFNIASEENVVKCHNRGYQKKNKTTLKLDKPFSCDKCDYICSRKSNLIRHSKGHTQEKPFKCNICNYCSNQAGNLKLHMYKHSGEVPFSCDKCDYRCRTKSSLIHHNRTHSLEKLFKCNVCDYYSNHVGNFKRHMFKHSGEMRFSCDKCDYKCCRKDSFIRHNRKHTQ